MYFYYRFRESVTIKSLKIMKKHHFIILLKCIGLTTIGFVLINILHALMDLIEIGVSEIDTITIRKGAIYFNDYTSGRLLGESSGSQALWIMFVFMAIINLNKRTTSFPVKSK